MILLLLIGCFTVTSSGVCEVETLEVSGDDALGDFDFTPADLAAAVLGVRTFPVSLVDGSIVTAELSLAAADAPILFRDATLTTGRAPRTGFGRPEPDIQVICDDELAIPLELDLATPDGSVDIVTPVGAVARRVGDDGHPGVDEVHMEQDLDPETDVFPPRPPATGAHVTVDLFGSSVDRVEVWWEGTAGPAAVVAYPPVVPE